MSRLIYLTNTSVDGYIADADGDFSGFAPFDDDVFAFITDMLRSIGTMLYGRRLYELMALWETDASLAERSEPMAEFARVWQGRDKIVYSTTLDEATTARTRLERTFDVEAVRALKQASGTDLMIGGADIAAQAFAAGLVDEYRVFVWPAVLGSGTPAMSVGSLLMLELVDERRFDNGVVLLSYRPAS